MITPDPLLGAALHAGGATAAALCYTPQQKLQGWSWQTYWLSQAFICWFLAPIIGAIVTIPHLADVLREAPKDAMLITFVLGVAYGIGGTAFGLAIRHIGYSLTYAIAIGISGILGTLAGPIYKRELAGIVDKPGAYWVLGGIAIGVLGTLMCGLAGRLKEVELSENNAEGHSFHLVKGLTLCVIAGVLSAIYGIALHDTGQPIADVAYKHGAEQWQTNVVYIFANTGAFLTTALYTLWRSAKEKTFGEFVRLDGAPAWALPMNYLLALLTGMLWYSQFLFYGTAHVRMGDHKFSGWSIHMTMLILFSSLLGVIMREWRTCRLRTKLVMNCALAVLLAAVLMMTYGNYEAEQAKAEQPPPAAVGAPPE